MAEVITRDDVIRAAIKDNAKNVLLGKNRKWLKDFEGENHLEKILCQVISANLSTIQMSLILDKYSTREIILALRTIICNASEKRVSCGSYQKIYIRAKMMRSAEQMYATILDYVEFRMFQEENKRNCQVKSRKEQ